MTQSPQVTEYIRRGEQLERLRDEQRTLDVDRNLTPNEEADKQWYEQATLELQASRNELFVDDWAGAMALQNEVAMEFGYGGSYSQGLAAHAKAAKDLSPPEKK